MKHVSCSSVINPDKKFLTRKNTSLSRILFSDLHVLPSFKQIHVSLIFLCTCLLLLCSPISLHAKIKSAENILSPVLPPVAICKNITVQLGSGGSVTVTGSQINGGSYDPDGTITSLVASPGTFTCSNTGPNNVTLTVTDNTGMTATCTAIVNVRDNTPPVMVCKNITLYLGQSGSATINPADLNNGSSDNCPGTLIFYISRTNFSCSDVGAPVSVTLTGTDASGNTAFCTSQVTVLDTVPPVVNVKTFTLVLDSDGTSTLLPANIDNGSFDNCGTVTLSVSPDTFTCGSVGKRTVTLTATDSQGNSSSKNVTIKVESSVKIESMALNNCDLAVPYALYKANINGVDSLYTYFWDGLEDLVKPFLSFIPNPPYLIPTNTSTLRTPFFNNATLPDGTYHIRLIVSDSIGCRDTSEMVFTKSGPVFNNITGIFSETCEGSTQIYTVNRDSGALYTWAIENGTILSADQDTNRIEVQWDLGVPQGVVSATVTKPNIAGDPCVSYMIDTVKINSVPAPVFDTPALVACSDSEYTYTLLSSFLSHTWSVTGGYITAGGSSGDSFVKVRWGAVPAGRVTISAGNIFTCSGSAFVDVAIDNLSGSVTSLTNISCNGGSDGKVTVAVTPGSGQPPYLYSLDGGAFVVSGSFAGISLGNHIVTIRDANLCTFEVPFVITQPSVPLASSASVTNVSCFGASTGTVNLTVTGGTAPYTFLWNNGAVTEDLTNVTAGVYAVTVTDANLCTTSSAATVAQPTAALSGTAAVTNVACYGGSTGAVNLTVSGGTMPYTFLWSNGSVTEDLVNVAAGVYSVTITDANACTTTASATVAQPAAALNGTTAVTNVACFGNATGVVNLTVTGGTAPYTYFWSNGAVTEDLTNITAGVYTVTITDVNSCTTVASGTVTQPAAALSGTTSVINVACFGGATGSVNLTVTGGTTPYSFLWSNSAVTEDLVNVAVGVYTVTITDANSCTTVASGTVTQPAAALNGTTAVTNVACYGNSTGAVNLTVTGGTAPYSYLWSSGAVTEDLINVAAGVYTVTITDANSCTTIATGTVTQPAAALNGTTAVTNVTCYGYSNGAVNLTVTGGTSPYTFLWSNGALTEDLTGVAAGVYTVTITDANSCKTTASGTVSQPPLLIATAGNNGPLCVNTALNLYAGPNGMTSYSWTGPNGFTSSAQNPVVSLNATLSMAGIYSLLITDSNGCTASTTTSVTIIDNNTISLSSGAGTSDQTICINTPLTNITFSTTIATGATFSGLPAGVTGVWASNVVTISGTPTESGVFNYSVTLTGGCGTIPPATGTITVNAFPVSVSIAADANPVCEGTMVTLTATPVNGGASPAYQWQVNGINVGTNANNYSYTPLNNDIVRVTLTSDVVCATGNPSTSVPVTMIVNANPAISVTDPAPVCSPATADLTAAAVTSGSTPGLIFTYWTDAAASVSYETPATATAGTYYIKGTDAKGCFNIEPVSVTVNPLPVVSSTQTNILCGGTSTGAIDITTSGGTGPYTYAWTGAGIVPAVEDQTGLAAGLYTVIVSDANNCLSAELPVTITELPALSGSIVSQTNVTVAGGNDGSVTVSGTQGTPPYQYRLDAGAFQPSGTFSTLTAAVYIVTVLDFNLCEFTFPVTITQPGWPLSGTVTSQTNVLCFGEATGIVSVTGLGGEEPYEYRLDGGAYQPSGTFSLLLAGTHTVTVRDALSDTYDVNVLITEPAAALTVTTTKVNVLCAGGSTGSATATAAGGFGPYTYSWSTSPVQTGPAATGLGSGTYTVTVTDANGCIVSTDVTISETVSLTINITQVNVRCYGDANGSATAEATGGTGPYAYSWNTSPVQTTDGITNLARGSYIVTVTDANGCTASETVQITEPEVLAVFATATDADCPDTNEGSITLEITGGTGPYSVIWMDGVPTQNREELYPKTYSVVVSDANACPVSTSVDVGFVRTFDCIEIPDIITPDGNGHNDEWQIRNIDIYPDAEILVYSRWGRLVYRTKNISDNPWNGQYRNSGDLMPTDSYHYILHLNDGSQPRSGVISVIR